MKYIRKITLIALSCLLTQSVYSQQDSLVSSAFFAADIGWTFPFVDMGKQYSSFMNINGMLGWKFSSNWLAAVDFGFQFGSNNVKDLDNILAGMMTDDKNSFIIGSDGADAGVIGYNRNLSLSLSIGKIFPIRADNVNSGVTVIASAGVLQHQIIYEATQSRVFQLEDDYKYGYDRQKRGFLAGIFAGYMHISKKSYVNWFAGVQLNMARTKMTRNYQYDMYDVNTQTFIIPDKNYNDGMITLKVGWMFPFFGKSANKIYYY